MGFTEASGRTACRWVAVRPAVSATATTMCTSQYRSCAKTERRQPPTTTSREHKACVASSSGSTTSSSGSAQGERAPWRSMLPLIKQTVRATATPSVDESELVRRLRRGGLLIRPRYAAGRDEVVAGYSVAVRPPAGEKLIWYGVGGERLARDLTLPRLLEGWPGSPQAAQGAGHERRATAKNPWQNRPVASGREEVTLAPEIWKQYSDEIGQLCNQLRDVSVTDRTTWAHSARETASAFAAWCSASRRHWGHLRRHPGSWPAQRIFGRASPDQNLPSWGQRRTPP